MASSITDRAPDGKELDRTVAGHLPRCQVIGSERVLTRHGGGLERECPFENGYVAG